jgi:regulator of sigma E protease
MNLFLAAILFSASFMVGGSEILLGYPQVAEPTSTTAAELGLQSGDILIEAGGVQTRVNAIAGEALQTTWEAPAAGLLGLTVVREGKPVDLPAVDSARIESFLSDPAEYVAVMNTVIEATAAGSPAETAGLQSDDLVYRVGDQVITLEIPLSEVVQQNLGSEIALTVMRGDELVTTRLTPRQNPPAGQGSLGVQIGPVSEFARLPVLKSIQQGIVSTGQYIMLVLQLPARLIMGTIDPSAAQVSGPVGIAREVGGAVTSSIDYGVIWPILRLAAVLSAALAITNLLPLPALDGGRLVFILIETVRGKRVSPEREGMVHMIGFMVLLSLMVLITVRDIAAPQATIDWSVILGQ